MNIVTERLDGEGFDLIVATNVFVYYDVLDQAIALSKIGAMLRPGGFFLSNTPMPGAGAPLRPAGSSAVTYWRGQPSSDGTPTTFGDHVFWYQRPRRPFGVTAPHVGDGVVKIGGTIGTIQERLAAVFGRHSVNQAGNPR